ncbi:hypothetical protein GCM10020366_59610 [Saccharopolyspora gregorii]|uniref:Uncharacterized protein n=1 Tax=Saccharopolyspora gregorii TaxID=33914 RepID=A0ABP6RZP2_9PSEU
MIVSYCGVAPGSPRIRTPRDFAPGRTAGQNRIAPSRIPAAHRHPAPPGPRAFPAPAPRQLAR